MMSNEGHENIPRGRMPVLGSQDVLIDKWIDEEGNGIMVEIIISFLLQRILLTFAQEKCRTNL
jgi:hypothetical protein